MLSNYNHVLQLLIDTVTVYVEDVTQSVEAVEPPPHAVIVKVFV